MQLSSWPAGKAAVLALFLSGAAHAQEAPNPSHAAEDAAEAAAEKQDEILVVGHRQHGAVQTEVPAEVTLGSVAIHALGAADLNEVLEDLAPEIRTGQGGPGTAVGTPIILVNGQRIAGFSAIKDLPPEAVRRIEVFPEKVALEYGYQPGQRVVNIVLRDRYKALTLLGRYTADPGGGRDLFRAKADLVHIGENSHWNIDLDYSHQDPIYDLTTLNSAGQVDPTAKHTLTAQSDQLALSGDSTSMIGAVSVDVAARLDLGSIQTRPGLSVEDGALLTSQGLPNPITGPFLRADRTVEAQTNLTLNGKIDSWRWSLVGKIDDLNRQTRSSNTPGDSGLDAIDLPSPGQLGGHCGTNASASGNCVSTDLFTVSQDAYLNGSLFRLPAGDVAMALRGGYAHSALESRSALAPQRNSLSRDQGTFQGNLDFPLTTRDSAIGKLSVGVNGEIDTLSDFGTQSAAGGSITWSPTPPIEMLGSFIRQDQAPTLMQLGQGALATPDLREFDFVQGVTSIIRQISGGNTNLTDQTSYTTKFRLQVKPLRTTDLTLSGEYTRERIHDPIGVLSAATNAAMAAFPDRFPRSAAGYLAGIDLSPVNFDRRDRQQIRWGITYSTGFGSTHPADSKLPGRDQFQIALYETWRFQDDVVLRSGQRTLDLLGHDIIGDKGGTPDHEIELQTSVSTGRWSLAANADWATPTSVDAGALGQDRLTFTQGITLGLKLQINLEDQHWLQRLLPFLRGYLNISADNLLGAHTRVHDASGNVPAAYDNDYVHPIERTFRISLRKRFR